MDDSINAQLESRAAELDNHTKAQLQEMVAHLEESNRSLNVMCAYREQDTRDAVGQERHWRNSAQLFHGDSGNHAAEAVRLTELSEQLAEEAREQETLAEEARALADKRARGSRAGGATTGEKKAQSIALIQSLFGQVSDTVLTKPEYRDAYRKQMCDMVSRLYALKHDRAIHTTYNTRKTPAGEHTYNRVFGTQFIIWRKKNLS
jgi:hypothetical protein